MNDNRVKVHVLPGGRMPKRQTEGAIGYDVYLRAIVCPHEMDAADPNFRKTLFDFKSMPRDPDVASQVKTVDGKLAYEMRPGESVLVGIGFVTEMEFPMFYWVAPRSGLASKWGITVTNAPGTVDPDYRGEAGVLVYNRNNSPYVLKHGTRIAQIVFQRALIPELSLAASLGDLQTSRRGSGGFGSTGLA